MLNQKEVDCVLEVLGPSQLTSHWYETLKVTSDGTPKPIGVSFSTLALWSQIEALARHPYVERIEPALGVAAKIGVAPPEIPVECPIAVDNPTPKLADAKSAVGGERQPVVIELQQGSLPSIEPCQGMGPCDEMFASGWARTVASRRMLTCVRSWIDSRLRGPAPDVAYHAADGIPTGPRLPPFADFIHATLAFGLALSWDETVDVAKHPFVRRVWTSPDLSIDTPPAGCPPNYDAPVERPVCPSTTESSDRKFSDTSRAEWQASPGPNEVIVSVRRTSVVCPRPDCPGSGSDCPEFARYLDRLMKEAEASQECVRALIASIGGVASPEVFVLGDGFPATLSWNQIQIVATHPHVVQIDSGVGGTKPP